jgi:hypothetical protein
MNSIITTISYLEDYRAILNKNMSGDCRVFKDVILRAKFNDVEECINFQNRILKGEVVIKDVK